MQLSPNNYLIIAIFPTFSQLAGIHMIKKYTRGDIQSVLGQHIPDKGAVTYIVLAVANQLTHKLTTNIENPNRTVGRQVDKKQFTWAAAVAAGIQRFSGIPHHTWIGHNPDQIDLFQDAHASGGEFTHIIARKGRFCLITTVSPACGFLFAVSVRSAVFSLMLQVMTSESISSGSTKIISFVRERFVKPVNLSSPPESRFLTWRIALAHQSASWLF